MSDAETIAKLREALAPFAAVPPERLDCCGGWIVCACATSGLSPEDFRMAAAAMRETGG